MANERLRNALSEQGMSVVTCAERLGVDPKTVERWITLGRVPHRTHRVAAARLLGSEEAYLWPTTAHDAHALSASRAELVGFFPTRSSVPPELWRSTIDGAREGIDVLAFAGQFLPEVHDVHRIKERAVGGCKVRLLLGDPEGNAVRLRGMEEGVGWGVAHRIVLTLRYYAPLLAMPEVELRLHDTTLYASIYRGDDTMLVNIHTFGSPAAQNPVLHLRRTSDGRVFDHYSMSFERVWAGASAMRDVDEVGRRLGFDREG